MNVARTEPSIEGRRASPEEAGRRWWAWGGRGGVQEDGPTGVSGGDSAEQREASGLGKRPEQWLWRPTEFEFYSTALGDHCTFLKNVSERSL